MTHSATMSRAQSCPSNTNTTNPVKPSQSAQRRLYSNARLCQLAQSLFGPQGIQDLSVVGVLFGNNIQQIGRFQIQCNGTMAQGLFSIHELVNSRVLAVSGRSTRGRRAARRRRQLKKRHPSSTTDQEMPLTPPSEQSKNHHQHHQPHQSQRPVLTPTLLAELFPLVVYRVIRKHTRRDRARLGDHGTFFSPPLPPITGGRPSPSRPPSFTPGSTSPSAQASAAVVPANSSFTSSSCLSQEPWSFGSLTPSDRLPGEVGDHHRGYGGEAGLSMDLSPPGDDELSVSSPEVLRRLFQRCLFHVPDLPLPDELCFLAAASFPLPQALRALHVAWTMEFLKHRVRSERRGRQQERRLTATQGGRGRHHHHTHHHRHPSATLFQRSPEMNTVLEEEPDEAEGQEGEHVPSPSTAQSEYKQDTGAAAVSPVSTVLQHAASHPSLLHHTTKPVCLGGLEFRAEVYAYKMRLARAARTRFIKQGTGNHHHQQSNVVPAMTTTCPPVDDVVETASTCSVPSTPIADTHAQAQATAVSAEAKSKSSPSSSSSSRTTLEQFMMHQDKERPDKRLMQQLLSLENKIPRIVRKWAHHARHFFAEELMREDSLAQKWVDEQRIEVVLGTGCHGHLATSAASSSSTFQQQQQQQQQQPSSFATAMQPCPLTHPSSHLAYANHPKHAQHQQQQQQQLLHHANSSREHHEQPHALPAAHMQHHLQQTMTNTTNMHTTSMMTTTTTTTNAIMTSMTNPSTHSPRLITGGTTPVTTSSTPRVTSFAEGIRLSRQGSHQSQGSLDFGSAPPMANPSSSSTSCTPCSSSSSSSSSSSTPSSNSFPPSASASSGTTTAVQPRTALRNSAATQSLGGAATTSTTTTTIMSSTTTGYHQRVSTSQQMLSLHLWLSCLVSPISPDQMVYEGFFEPLDPQVYP